MRGKAAGSSRTRDEDDEERELELGTAESDWKPEADPGAIYLYVPDLESPTGWVSRPGPPRAPDARRAIGFRRDDGKR